ncbi:MAG: bifunctional nuclease family protein [Bacteroidales bacterium]|jgi:bifunctional DNase/RNase|nr:bifunctional nuclease family protein [Bacteroidales bacterium]
MKELQILGFNSVDNDAKAASLQLTDKNGIQNVNILIGDHEMGMLGLALNGAKTQRPTTYDLFKSLCESAGYAIKAVLIYNLKNGIFFSKLLIKDADGKNLEFESSVSDGINIATIFKVQILI